MIEVEIRSLLTDDDYNRLRKRLDAEAEFIGEELQETHYLHSDNDVRVQKGSKGKIWSKKGAMHSDAREEVEVFFDAEHFPRVLTIFKNTGHESKVVWKRLRREYSWEGVAVCLDDTEGYGRILELELLSEKGEEEKALKDLNQKIRELGVEPTPKAVFDAKYQEYVSRGPVV